MRRITALAVLLMLIALPTLVLAQGTGTIRGTVTDATGAVVSGATVTARNMDTNATRTATSSDTGAYSIPNLPPGNYEIKVEAGSFKTAQFTDVEVTTSQILALNPKLEPGAATDLVTVTGSQMAPIETETATLSNIVDERRIKDLPLLTRNPYELVGLTAGAAPNDALGGFSVNGSRERNNNFTLDGVDNNDTSVPGGLVTATNSNPETAQEFRIITNNFLPEYGRNTGAIIDVVTKSGTNAFHGDAYWFGRYDEFGARDYFNHGTDPSTGEEQLQAPYNRNQFGFSVGGPIVKDRTFFFFNSEWKRFRTSIIQEAVVPTAAFKSGVFPYTHTDSDGNTTVTTIDLNDGGDATNEAGISGISPTMADMLALYPDPDPSTIDPEGLTGLYRFPSASRQDQLDLTGKLDHRFSDRFNLSMRYGYNDFTDPNAFFSDFLPGLDAVSLDSKGNSAALTFTQAYTPTLINETRFGWNKIEAAFGCGGVGAIDEVSPTIDQFGYGKDLFLPVISGFGCFTLGNSNGQARDTGTTQIANTLTWVKGNHTAKFGGDVRWVREDSDTNFVSRELDFFNLFSGTFAAAAVNVNGGTCNPNSTNFDTNDCGSANLQDMAWMYWGVVDTLTQSQYYDLDGNRVPGDFRQYRQREGSFFLQDSWKIRPNFTLNYGVRWSYNGVPFEENNLMTTTFQDVGGPTPDGGFEFVPVGPGTGNQLYNDDYTQWEPRLGFAWDPFGQGTTVIRGGYGIFHDRIFGNIFGNARGNLPFTTTLTDFPGDFIENLGVTSDTGTSSFAQEGDLHFPVIIPRDTRMPRSQNWNLGIQHELFNDLVVELNYVGSRGTRLLRTIDGNPPDMDLVEESYLFDQAILPLLGIDVDCEFFDNADNDGSGVIGDSCNDPFLTGAILRQRTTFFAQFGLFGWPSAVPNEALSAPFLQTTIGQSRFHSMQLNVTKRMSKGFQVQGNYTWAHSIDDSGDPLVPNGGNRQSPRTSRCRECEEGDSDFDIRQRLVVNYIWELPFGRGRRWASEGVAGKILEGFQVSGITTFQTGIPYDIFSDRDSGFNGLSARPDLITNGDFDTEGTQTGPTVDMFERPLFGRLGTLGRNYFNGPGFVNTDISIAKKTRITERLGLETRLELFNIFNRAHFDNPSDNNANLFSGPTTNTSLFGHSSDTVLRPDGTTSARQMQFALKLTF